MSNYDQLLLQLKEVRERQSTTKGLMDKMITAVKESDEYKAFQTMNETETELISDIEKKLRELALYEFKETGNKKPHEKVQVKMFKTFKIVNPEVVLTWVKKNLSDALKLDETKVKKYAMEIGVVEGTEITEEPRAQIATEL